MKTAVLAAVLFVFAPFALNASARSSSSAALPNGIAPLLAAMAAPAGSPSSAVVFPVGDLRAQLAQYIGEAKAKGSAGTTLEDYGSYQLQLSVRGRSSAAEVSTQWDNVMIVEQGGANLITGGRLVGARAEGGGERRGVRIEGGQQEYIGAGDVVTVRAGTPYQLILAPGTVYSAFLVRIHEPGPAAHAR